MARVTQTIEVDPALAEELLGPRRDLVEERPWAPGDDGPAPPPDAGGPPDADRSPAAARRATYALARGPMLRYRRDVEARPGRGGRVTVTETTDFRLALGVWSLAVVGLVRRGLRRTSGRSRPRSPAWAPPEQLDLRAGTVLGLLCTLSLVTGYLGTVITQTITYAAEEFGRGTTAQGGVLAAVRAGVLGSLALVALSDRRGRRRLLLGAVAGGCLATATGAFAPSMELLGLSQTVARSLSTAAALLLAVVAAEEMPKGARAYAVSVMAMTGALGAGIAVWALPLADLGPRGWRIIYVIPLLGLPVVAWARTRLPESKRFVRPHPTATVLRGHGRRLVALAAAFFGASAFASPSSQLLNEFLRDERGFSAARISLFTILTSTPAGIALVAGGRLADTRGRRQVVALGVAGGGITGALCFSVAGWSMWALNLTATMLAALATPALGAYGPELFPTGARAKANGVVQLASVAGSAVGLVVAGAVADRTGRLADGMYLLLPLTLAVAVLALTVFPETARRELEDLNPEDDLPAGGSAPAPPEGGGGPGRPGAPGTAGAP